MSRVALFKEELELDKIRETELQLLQLEQEFAESQKRYARERIERESTMPPLDEIQDRERRRLHEDIVSRGELSNKKRDHSRSLLLLFLLLTATATLVWWGLQLMQAA